MCTSWGARINGQKDRRKGGAESTHTQRKGLGRRRKIKCAKSILLTPEGGATPGGGDSKEGGKNIPFSPEGTFT